MVQKYRVSGALTPARMNDLRAATIHVTARRRTIRIESVNEI